jgi:putative colanic acid biosynthesis glycosyltransferase
MRPVLSIITINLNNCIGLINTFHSLKEVLIVDIEWIVIDGLSNDNSIESLKYELLLIDGLKEQITIVEEEDLGIYDAMNKGVDLSIGRYFWFLNSGDVLVNANLFRGWLHQVRSEKFPPVNFFFGFVLSGKRRVPRSNFWIIWKMVTSHQAMLIHESVFLGFRYPIKLLYAADYKLTHRIIKEFPIEKNKNILIENEPYGSELHAEKVRREYFSVCCEYFLCPICYILYRLKRVYEKN